MAKRFEYILINSAYTAAIQGDAVQANLAFTKKQNTIRSVTEFNRTDRVLIRNRGRFQQEVNTPASNLHEAVSPFIKALEEHPIFTIIQHKDEDSNITIPEKIKLGNKAPLTKNKVDQQEPIYELVKELFKTTPDIVKNGTTTVKGIIKNIMNADYDTREAINYFQQKNQELILIAYQNKPKQIRGNKEHNFIVALMDRIKE